MKRADGGEVAGRRGRPELSTRATLACSDSVRAMGPGLPRPSTPAPRSRKVDRRTARCGTRPRPRLPRRWGHRHRDRNSRAARRTARRPPRRCAGVSAATPVGPAVVVGAVRHRRGPRRPLPPGRRGRRRVTSRQPWHSCDVSDPGQVDAAAAATANTHRHPPAVHRVRRHRPFGDLLEVDPDDSTRVIVNARGSLLAMRSAAGAMTVEGAAGSIVVLSSVSGRIADRTMGAYCASKAALSMTVKVAAAEWADAGIEGERGGARGHRHPHARRGAPGRGLAGGDDGPDPVRWDRHAGRHRRGGAGRPRDALGHRPDPRVRRRSVSTARSTRWVRDLVATTTTPWPDRAAPGARDGAGMDVTAIDGLARDGDYLAVVAVAGPTARCTPPWSAGMVDDPAGGPPPPAWSSPATPGNWRTSAAPAGPPSSSGTGGGGSSRDRSRSRPRRS